MFKQELGNVFSNKNDMYMLLFNTKWVNVRGREKGLIKRFFLLFSSHLENTEHCPFLLFLIARHLFIE